MNVQKSASFHLGIEPAMLPKGHVADLSAIRIEALPPKHRVENIRRLQIVSNAAEMAKLASAWIELETASTRSVSVFQTWAWSMAFVSATASEENAPKIIIVAGWWGDQLDFLMPLACAHAGPVRCLRWLTDPYGQYGDVLVRDNTDVEPWIDRAMATLREQNLGDALQLRHVREGAAIAPWLKVNGKSSKVHHGAPSMDLRECNSEAELDLKLNKEQRRRRRRTHAGLEAIGPVEFCRLSGADAEAAIDEAIAVKRSWIGDRGLFADAVNQPRFNITLKKACSFSGQGTLNMLVTRTSVGGRPVAWEIGMRTAHRHFVYLTAYAADLAALSPARYHMDTSLRNAINEGMNNFDLMIPNDAYKASWSNNVVAAEDYYLSLTPRGAFYGRVWLGMMRPLARKIYYAAPDKLRHILTRLASRQDPT